MKAFLAALLLTSACALVSTHALAEAGEDDGRDGPAPPSASLVAGVPNGVDGYVYSQSTNPYSADVWQHNGAGWMWVNKGWTRRFYNRVAYPVWIASWLWKPGATVTNTPVTGIQSLQYGDQTMAQNANYQTGVIVWCTGSTTPRINTQTGEGFCQP
jgi:hypothetical protein